MEEKSFAERVELQSSLSSKSHAYPRPDLNALHQYLKTPGTAILQVDRSDETRIDESDFVLVRDLDNGQTTSFGSTSAETARLSAHNFDSNPSLVFVRGHASPQWLEAVAAKFRPSPELFQRHLHRRAFASGDRDLHNLPPLPSWNTQTFQLKIPTICHRSDVPFSVEPEDLDEDRRLAEDHMKQYFKNIRMKARVGDSVVRNYLVFSKQESVLEQTITIEVIPASEERPWQVIMWLDSGRDLSQSVDGPWLPREGSRPWQTYFFPVIVQRFAEKLARRAVAIAAETLRPTNPAVAAVHGDGSTSTSLRGAGNKSSKEWEAAQNICALPLQYGQQLDGDLARQDAFYVLSEAFQFAASSELQLLNFVQRRIEHEMSFASQDEMDRRNAISLVNLRYIMANLQSHRRRLAENVSILENRDWSAWPAATNSSVVDRVAHGLMVDYKHLLDRATTLIQTCSSGMDTLANSSVLEEARRSTENAMRLQRLTVIATVFIPLSFVCSVWGMNVKELGSGSQPMWLYAATALPVIILSISIYFADVLVRACRKAFASLTA